MQKDHLKEAMRASANELIEEVSRLTNLFQTNNGSTLGEAMKISLLMLNMECDKMMSVISLLDNGIMYKINDVLTRRYSYISPFPIVRSSYELMLMHHCLFVNPKSVEDMLVLMNLWKIKGLKQRTKYENNESKSFLCQKEKDIKYIEELVGTIKSTDIYKNCKSQFDHAFDTDKLYYFEIIRTDTKPTIKTTSFGDKNLFDYVFNDLKIFPTMNNDVVYNYLSLNSHPTYISVLQFQQQNALYKKDFSLECILFFIYRMIKSHYSLTERVNNPYNTKS